MFMNRSHGALFCHTERERFATAEMGGEEGGVLESSRVPIAHLHSWHS